MTYKCVQVQSFYRGGVGMIHLVTLRIVERAWIRGHLMELPHQTLSYPSLVSNVRKK